MNLRPIKTGGDYRAALAEIEGLFQAEPETPEGDRLDILTLLVQAYEEQHHPIPPPDPLAALEYHLESRGLTRRDLEPYLGSRARVAEVMNRRRTLTIDMIRRLHQGLGIPACRATTRQDAAGGNGCRIGASPETTKRPGADAPGRFPALTTF